MTDETMERGEMGTAPEGPEAFVRRGEVLRANGATIMSLETYARSIGYSADGKPLSLTARFAQGEWWRRKTGEWVRIAEMSPGHRYNTAAMLMRNAPAIAFRHAWAFGSEAADYDGGEMAHDALERIAVGLTEQAVNDPSGWLQSTTLYRALTAGLAVQGAGTEPHQKTGRDPVTGEPASEAQ